MYLERAAKLADKRRRSRDCDKTRHRFRSGDARKKHAEFGANQLLSRADCGETRALACFSIATLLRAQADAIMSVVVWTRLVALFACLKWVL